MTGVILTDRTSPPRTATDRMDVATKEAVHSGQAGTLRYPGPVGELLSQELLSWMVFGHLLGCDLIMRVAADLNAAPPPE